MKTNKYFQWFHDFKMCQLRKKIYQSTWKKNISTAIHILPLIFFVAFSAADKDIKRVILCAWKFNTWDLSGLNACREMRCWPLPKKLIPFDFKAVCNGWFVAFPFKKPQTIYWKMPPFLSVFKTAKWIYWKCLWKVKKNKIKLTTFKSFEWILCRFLFKERKPLSLIPLLVLVTNRLLRLFFFFLTWHHLYSKECGWCITKEISCQKFTQIQEDITGMLLEPLYSEEEWEKSLVFFIEGGKKKQYVCAEKG